MASVRRLDGFARYALAVQYHGKSFLGFSYQPTQEDTILPDGTDLRGLRTVEGRIREALNTLVGDENFENFQVSSRTDRGVHAIKNSCHVDIRPRQSSSDPWDTRSLHDGINFYLSRQGMSESGDAMTQMRILAVHNAPLSMKNVFYDGTEKNGPEDMDWNARFSATDRTYVYRILQSNASFGVPFEFDRSWRIAHQKMLNVDAMNEAAQYLIGSQDVSSFRGAKCARHSPIVTMNDVSVTSQPYGLSSALDMSGSMFGSSEKDNQSLVLVKLSGKSFVYRQVRNMVGCLLEVGREKLSPMDVKRILEERDRTKAPAMAPAHGLFLVDVKHGDFII